MVGPHPPVHPGLAGPAAPPDLRADDRPHAGRLSGALWRADLTRVVAGPDRVRRPHGARAEHGPAVRAAHAASFGDVPPDGESREPEAVEDDFEGWTRLLAHAAARGFGVRTG